MLYFDTLKSYVVISRVATKRIKEEHVTIETREEKIIKFLRNKYRVDETDSKRYLDLESVMLNERSQS